MTNSMRALVAVFLTGLALLMVFKAGLKFAVAGGAAVGLKAPDFTLTDLDGNGISLSDYEGKVVLLNLWATYCGPCREEMPSLNGLMKKMADYSFVILTINIDPGKSERVREFMEENGYTFKVLHDPKKEISALYYFTGIPTTYIIDMNGIIVDKSVGAEDWESRDRIDQLKALSTVTGSVP
ncbi:MAG: TlpA family protein disulfide reductase [Deltaproteobacteria bacterium]|uniref:TlpA family protein disulfide reductase n=1 Tax=Candidatus Zymogenus saltonus TaxID=2844893 RepID=A0A9D8KH99_9DELT|nr:TlpA family protein disulfide reductase [Candidatus Zymogenus saltonus]